MVAQVDEQHAAMVADAVAPAGKPGRMAGMGLAEFSAIMRAVTMHFGVLLAGRKARAGDSPALARKSA
jgi:hypothetical protein